VADDNSLGAPRSAGAPPDAPPQKSSPSRGGFAGVLAVMRFAGYRNYTIGSTISVIGVWLQRMATGWLVWQLTESPSWLGIITFSDLFVMMLLSPIAGVVADRVDRLKLLHIAQLMFFSQAVAVTLFYAAGWMTIELLLALTIFQGMAHAVHTAARLALLPNLVPKDLLPQAIAVNALSFNVARFMGPAFAGLVITNWGLTPAFAINAMTFVVFSLLLLSVRVTVPDKPRTKSGMFSEMVEGGRYAARHVGIAPLLFLTLVTSFTIRALPDLMPAFAGAVFERGVHGLAWLTSAMGLGAMVGGLVIARQRGLHGLTRKVIWNAAFMALAIAALASTDYFPLGVMASAACGFALTVNGTGVQTLIQSSVDGALRGRVMGFFTLLYQGAPAIGAVALGTIADQFGMQAPFLAGALLCFLVFIWTLQRTRPIAAALEGGPSPRPQSPEMKREAASSPAAGKS
jgi:predicted MFS family arabinose efflux permease